VVLATSMVPPFDPVRFDNNRSDSESEGEPDSPVHGVVQGSESGVKVLMGKSSEASMSGTSVHVPAWQPPEVAPTLQPHMPLSTLHRFTDHGAYVQTAAEAQQWEHYKSAPAIKPMLEQKDLGSSLVIFTPDGTRCHKPTWVMLDSGSQVGLMVSPRTAEKLGCTPVPGTGQLAGVGGVGGSSGRTAERVLVRIGGVSDGNRQPSCWEGSWSGEMHLLVMTQELVDTIGVDVIVGYPIMEGCRATIDLHTRKLHFSPAWMEHGCADFRVSIPLCTDERQRTVMAAARNKLDERETWHTMTRHIARPHEDRDREAGLGTEQEGQCTKSVMPIRPGFPQTAPVATRAEYDAAQQKQRERNQLHKQEGLRVFTQAANQLTAPTPSSDSVWRLSDADIERIASRTQQLVLQAIEHRSGAPAAPQAEQAATHHAFACTQPVAVVVPVLCAAVAGVAVSAHGVCG
jgi:hypothetical protein